jgi:hypothetical protein
VLIPKLRPKYLAFDRQAVAQEFERLVRDGVPVAEMREVDERELDRAEEAYAKAQP